MKNKKFAMNKYIIIFAGVLLLAMAIGFGFRIHASAAVSGTVTASNLFVRTGPSTEYPKVEVNGKIAVFQGIDRLKADTVKAVDLRAGAAMVIAGLCAEGETFVEDIHHIERGYETPVEKLRALGADIEQVDLPDETR